MKLRVRDGGDVQRQWTATEMPRMRHDLVEHARGDLDRLAHPGVRDVLRRERVGQFNEFTKKPVTDDMFEAEMAGQIDRTRRDLERYRESELFWVTRGHPSAGRAPGWSGLPDGDRLRTRERPWGGSFTASGKAGGVSHRVG